MENLSSRIRARMAALKEKYPDKKINQRWLAQESGVSTPAVTKWLDGRTLELRGNALLAAAKALECSPAWLSGLSKELVEAPKTSTIKVRPIKVWDNGDPLEDDEVEVPMLDVKLSAGSGRLQWEVNETGVFNRFRKSWCISHGFNPEKLTTMVVDGESMSDVLPDGASVTIYTADTHIRNGKVYAIDYLGQFMIKQLFVMPDGGVKIISKNPDKETYPDIIVKPTHEDALIIMGRAVSYSANL